MNRLARLAYTLRYVKSWSAETDYEPDFKPLFAEDFKLHCLAIYSALTQKIIIKIDSNHTFINLQNDDRRKRN